MKTIIELGTNSVKLFMYKLIDGIIDVIIDEQMITRLGEDYNKTGIISKTALKRTISVIKKCINTSQKKGCMDISLFGTMILRKAENRQMVLMQIAESTGYNVKVLTGEEEAFYAYTAALKTLDIKDHDKVLVVDSGGGSTEFIFGEGNNILHAESINVGAVTLTEKYKLNNTASIDTMLSCELYVNRTCATMKKQYQSDKLIAIGGSATTVSAMVQQLKVYDVEKVQGSIITMEQISELQNLLCSMDSEERKTLSGLSAKRADIILGGVAILGCIIDRSNIGEMIVCDRGLRYGLAYSI
jgi:exopolyphosphatase/guanosine-5'-triphosphate,3'-diphosphate pyrophosphatase